MTVIVIFILVMKQTKLSDIVMFSLNPLKLKPYILYLIDMLLLWYLSDRLRNIMMHIDSTREGIVPPLILRSSFSKPLSKFESKLP